jgi:hypothetical protein
MIRAAAMTLVLAGAVLSFSPDQLHAQKRKRDVITRDEIQSSLQREQDLLTAIRSLRPHFLESRGVRTLGNSIADPIAIYIDGVRQSGVDILQSMMAANVNEVRYLEPSRAVQEYGSSANGGAVVVKLYTSKP